MERARNIARLRLFLALLAVAAARPAQAAEPDAAAFVAEVLARNPTLQAAQLRKSAASRNAAAEGLLPDPSVNVMFDRFPDRMAEMPMVRWQVQQMLPWPGKLGLMRAAAQAQTDTAAAEIEVRRLDLVLAAKRAWWMLAMNARRREVNRTSAGLLEAIVRATRARYAAGTGGHHALARAEVERNALEVEHFALEGERAAAVAMLNALRNQPSELPIADPPSVETPLVPLELGKLTETALGNRPEFRAMQAMQREMRSMADLARRERYPDLMVGVWWNTMIGGPDTAGAMVGGTIPLFGIRRQGLRAEVQSLRADAIERDLDAMRAMVRFEVADAVRKVDTATRQVAFLRGTATARAKESFAAALSGYVVGSVDISGLLDARRALQVAHQALADTALQREIAIAELERALWGHLPEESQ